MSNVESGFYLKKNLMIFFSVVRSLKHRYVDLGWKMKGFDVFHAGLLAYVLNKIEKRAHV